MLHHLMCCLILSTLYAGQLDYAIHLFLEYEHYLGYLVTLVRLYRNLDDFSCTLHVTELKKASQVTAAEVKYIQLCGL